MPTAVRSHAKINLGLYVGGPRPDGFHGLTTVYQTLELHDVVTVTARPAEVTRLRLTSNDKRVPTDRRNTAWKMVELALDALGLAAEVEIHIDKRLPVQGGMGAGSANAVAALVGLEVELGIGPHRKANAGPSTTLRSGSKNAGLSTMLRCAQDDSSINTARDENFTNTARGDKSGENPLANLSGFPPSAQTAREGWGTEIVWTDENWLVKRLEIAAEVGSDVPLFLIGGTSLGVDRGQEVYPLPDLEPVWCVVALPQVGVSTAQAFRDWDALCASGGLTPEASADKLKQLSRAYAGAFAGGVQNGPEREGGQGAGSFGALALPEGLAGPQESALVRTGISSWIENDFERVVFSQQPSLREIKRLLAAPDTPEASLVAMLSGSGSALFGLYLAREAANAACQRLQSAGVRSQLTRTLPRSAYWQQMLS